MKSIISKVKLIILPTSGLTSKAYKRTIVRQTPYIRGIYERHTKKEYF